MDYALKNLVRAAREIGLAEAARREEERKNGVSAQEINRRMLEALQVMRQSAEKGFDPDLHSVSGMTGGQAARLQSADACAFALMNVMGLVCDPVRGLVEVPCVYRNASGVAGAFVAADRALAGVPCPLPPDEVIDAMKAVGEQLPPALRETGEGGCAACPSARHGKKSSL